jgi:hypothetical protein
VQLESSAPAPRIVLLGAEPRAIGLLELYRLAGHPDVALADRRPERAGQDWQSCRIAELGALSRNRLEAVIVTEDPIGDYADAVELLRQNGIAPERIVTCAQPGRAHRLLAGLIGYSAEELRRIGYGAVRQNLYHRGHYALSAR